MTRLNRSRLYMIVGPSGVGKNTLLEGLMANLDRSYTAVSTTTRSPRSGEKHGVHYRFCDTPYFEHLISQGMLLQYVLYSGNFYGLEKGEIDSKLLSGDVFTIVEPEGVKQLKIIYPEAVSLFIRPTNTQVLVDRMRARGDEISLVEKRMATHTHFMDFLPQADYILNDGLPEHVLEDAMTIIKRKRNE